MSIQVNLLNLLHDTFIKQNRYKSIQWINTKLLFRASEHNYSSAMFHLLCNNKGPTITIIHNSNDHIYGGYTSKSWEMPVIRDKSIEDPNMFLFMIRPNVEAILPIEKSLRKPEIVMTTRDGPVFGVHVTCARLGIWKSHISVRDNCNVSTGHSVYGEGGLFDFNSLEMAGIHEFRINEYEVFNVTVE